MRKSKFWKKRLSGLTALVLAALMIFSCTVYAAEGSATEAYPEQTEIVTEAEAETAEAIEEDAAAEEDAEAADAKAADDGQAAEDESAEAAEDEQAAEEDESAEAAGDEQAAEEDESAEAAEDEQAAEEDESAEAAEDEQAAEEDESAEAAEDEQAAKEDESAEAAEDEQAAKEDESAEAADDEQAAKEDESAEAAEEKAEDKKADEAPAAESAKAEETPDEAAPAKAETETDTPKNADETYTVKFNLNGGTVGSSPYYTEDKTITAGNDVYLATGNYVATKEGYTLAGWSLTKGGEKLSGYYYTPTKDTTLYAVWAVTYHVHFRPNGGTWEEGYEYYENPGGTWYEGQSSLSTPYSGYIKREGYSLAGWSKTPDGDPIQTYGFTTTKDCNLYAVWRQEFIVHFRPNGGTWEEGYEHFENPGTTWYEGGYLSTPSSYCITKDGFVLAGWSTTPDGNPIQTYNFTTTKNCNLYAVWRQEFIVHFRPNGGAWSSDSYYEQYENPGRSWYEGGYLSTPSSSYLTYDGYALAGWSLTKTGDPIDTSSFTTAKNCNLYAVWKKQYTIKFDLNGGSWASDYGRENYGSGVIWYEGKSSLDTPYSSYVTKSGYVLAGWSKTKTGDPIQTYGFKTTKDLTLYAVWRQQFTVKLNPNGGTWGEGYESSYASRTVTEGNTCYLPVGDEYVIKSKYKLVGWSTEKTGGTIIRSSYRPTANVTLYAQWKAAWTVTFNGNGGKIEGNSKVLVVRGESVYLPVYQDFATRSGYQLAGWTVEKGTGTVMRSSYTPTANTTLYASWAKNVTLTLNAGSGKFASNNKSTLKYIVGSGLPVGDGMPAPTLKGNVFLGWYFDSDCTKPVKKASTFTKARTLYAKWQAKPIKVIVYNLKGASYTNRATGEYIYGSDSTVDSYSFLIDKGDAIGSVSASKSGYRAMMYFDADYTKPYYSSYIPTTTTRIYIKWVQEVTVTWNAAGGARMSYYSDGYAEAQKTGTVSSYKTLMCEQLPTRDSMKRTGYYFIGWYLSTDTSKTVLPASHVFNKNATVKAKWGTGIKITLKLAGGTMSSYYSGRFVPSFYTKKGAAIESIVGYVPQPSKEGYRFNGWKNSVTGEIVWSLSSEKPTQATTYTATWKTATSTTVKTVTVTLKGGFGSIWDEDNQKYVVTLKVKVPKNSYYYQNFLSEYAPSHDERGKHLVFTGWSAVKENGKELTDDYQFTDSTTVLYPIWKVYDLRVALVTNGGSYGNRAQNTPIIFMTPKDGLITLPTKSDMEREGYTFGGWYSDPKFTNKLSNQKKYRVTKSGVYLYAKWVKNS